MAENSKDIQLQYEGFLKTPQLWEGNAIFNLAQIEIETQKTQQFNSNQKIELRLGKRVEQFSFFTFQQDLSIDLISENLQIQDGKRTVGEIDCILSKNNQPTHIEIVYKYYLYDDTVGNTEIEHWIGPNRRDSFFQKLTKLKEKQLPLLHSQYTKNYLEKLQLNVSSIYQKVYFKAQLFVPLNDLNNIFSEINNNCICGFYIRLNQLKKFEDCKFYIPKKVDWLKEIQTNVKWLNFATFETQIVIFLYQQSAPLCWIKKPNGKTQKFFVVWWD